MSVQFEGGDDSLAIDFQNIEESKFEVIPKGKYPAIIEECEYQLSKSSGKPMWAIKLMITDGEYAERKLFTHVSFSEKALPMAKTAISRIAPELLKAPLNPKAVAESGTLVGRQVMIRVDIQKYEGEDRNRVKEFLVPSQSVSGDGFLAV